MQRKESGKRLATVAGALALVAVGALKFKAYILAFLKALPFLKLGWLLKGSWTMLVSLGLYTVTFGWRYAITIVALIYVHECGHYLWMMAKGLKPQAPVFIPFLGAYVAMTHLPSDKATHAWVALAGPLGGGLAAIGLYYLGEASGNDFCVAAASTGLLLNLLQLVPLRPFDGGFIAMAISRWLYIPGAGLLLFAALTWQSPLLILLSALGIFQIASTWRTGGGGTGLREPAACERTAIALSYFGLALLLAVYFIHAEGAVSHLHAR